MIPVPANAPTGVRALPWLSLSVALITLLLLVFWQWQYSGAERELRLEYQRSGLQELEVAAWISRMRLEGHAERARRVQTRQERGDNRALFRTIAWDRAFTEHLADQGERYWNESELEHWQSVRPAFSESLESLPRARAGLVPADPSPGTLVTFHFLNPNLLHWLVAVLVLLPFARGLEAVLGTVRTALIWPAAALLAGAAAALLPGAQHLPLISTTVLASTMTGMYLGHFGTARVNFPLPDLRRRGLQWRQWPAAVLAPLWLLLPAHALLTGEPASLPALQLIALVAGAVLVQLGRLQDLGDLEEETEPDEQETELRARLASGWAALGTSNFAEAERQFQAAVELEPEHFDALSGLYQVRKLNPDSEDWLATTERLLSLPCDEPGRCRQQYNVLREARSLQPELSLSENTRCRLAINLAGIGAFNDADGLLGEDDAQSTEPALRRQALEALAELCRRQGDQSRTAHYLTRAEKLAG